jgi:hypothetical protein
VSQALSEGWTSEQLEEGLAQQTRNRQSC